MPIIDSTNAGRRGYAPLMQDLVGTFYDAWNRGDAEAISGLLGSHGDYLDPVCRSPVRDELLIAHLRRFFAAFRSLRIDVARKIDTPSAVAVEWQLAGVCEGEIDSELKAQGVPVRLTGMDTFTIEGASLTSVRRVFDRRALADALGLQVVVEPFVTGTMTFGYSLREWISKQKPGALGMTWILARDEAEKAAIRTRAREIIRHFRSVPGFIGIVTGFAGLHGFTFTAWESEEALRNGTHTGAHLEAMKAFREGLSAGVFTSVWAPARLNRQWTRCPNGHPNDAMRPDRACEQCGAQLPEREPYL
jgi:heme-degrading monooxygenase HmoA